MDTLTQVLQYGLMIIGGVVPVATALVRLPFLQKFEGDVSGFIAGVQKVLAVLPTLGKNPATKKLEEAADKVIVEKDQKAVEDLTFNNAGKVSEKEYSGSYVTKEGDKNA